MLVGDRSRHATTLAKSRRSGLGYRSQLHARSQQQCRDGMKSVTFHGDGRPSRTYSRRKNDTGYEEPDLEGDFPEREKQGATHASRGWPGRDARVSRVAMDGYSGLARSRECAAQWPPRACAQQGPRSSMDLRRPGKSPSKSGAEGEIVVTNNQRYCDAPPCVGFGHCSVRV